MVTQKTEDSPPTKRRKLNDRPIERAKTTSIEERKGLERPISPPFSRKKAPGTEVLHATTWSFDNVPKASSIGEPSAKTASAGEQTNVRAIETKDEGVKSIASPIQLTQIEEMKGLHNVDAVGLKDILGDPMIKACWNFNYLFDLHFVMQHFDRDVRDMIKVKIVHGFWRRDDQTRIHLLEQADSYSNVELLTAYIPDPFGTHHSKMLVLFRHDDTAQVIVHTANMISRDWKNMTQAIWKSPLLPLKPDNPPPSFANSAVYVIGSGERFKVDLLQYLGAYGKSLRALTQQLANYDFTAIRAAFVGSAPSRQKPTAANPASHTSFGWPGLQETLSTIPISKTRGAKCSSNIVIQISSIATLGASPTWLTHFQNILARHSTTTMTMPTEPGVADTTDACKPLSSDLSKRVPTSPPPHEKGSKPKYNIIFPTPEEIRSSLDGYVSGGSIHWKLQSAQQQKQLEYMLPLLCHWKHNAKTTTAQPTRQAHRGPAAPHIKTYIRFSDDRHETIDWAMLTSANLSKQAWGDVVNKNGEVWIQSWEAGVVVWPALFTEHTGARTRGNVRMVPVFGKDMPGREDLPRHEDTEAEAEAEADSGPSTVVGFRMPYDLPLQSYAPGETPWCATLKYTEPDWMGRQWTGY